MPRSTKTATTKGVSVAASTATEKAAKAVKVARPTLASLTEEVRVLNAKLTQAEAAERKALERQAQAAQGEREALEAHKASEKTILSLREQLTQKESLVAELNNSKAAEHKFANKALESAAARETELAQLVDKEQKELQSVREELQLSKDALAYKDKELMQLNIKVQDKDNQLAEVNSKLDEALVRASNLDQAKSQMACELASATTKVADLSHVLEMRDNKLEKLHRIPRWIRNLFGA